MNDPAKTLIKPKASGSGTHNKVVSNPASTTSLDEEFNAFFDQGDAGEYEGSLYASPLSVDPVTYDEPKQELPVAKTKARRAFFAKMVTGVVAGCTMLMLVAVGLKAIPIRARERHAARMAEVAHDHKSVSREVFTIATPTKQVSAVPPEARSVPPQPAQQEQPVAATEPPQVAPTPAAQEQPSVEPVAAESFQVAQVPAAQSERQPDAVPEMSSAAPPKVLKPARAVYPMKPRLARSTAKSRHSTQASTKSTVGAILPAPAAASKPSVVAFPVD